MPGTHHPPVTPGEILALEFLEPLGLSPSSLARAIGLPEQHIAAIIAGQRAICADTAQRLAGYFGTTPEFWLNLQAHADEQLAAIREGLRGDAVGDYASDAEVSAFFARFGIAEP